MVRSIKGGRSQSYRACFDFAKKKRTFEFHDFDTMLAGLHENWPVLKSKHNLVVGHKKHKDKKIIDDQSLREVLGMAAEENINAVVDLYVDMKSHGYSWYATHRDEALDRIRSSNLLITEETFARDESIISDQQYNTAADVLCSDLFDRVRVLDLEQSTEYTMRELISPVLIRALCLVDDYNERANTTKVRLICEKVISGSSGHGPVDYVMSYLHVLIVIGEAKHKDLIAGFYQNLVQQQNALDSLADKIVGSATVGSKRSHKFVEVLSSLRGLGTYGITSTGKEWIFSRTVPDPSDATRVKVFKSQSYALFASATATAEEKLAMKSQVIVLLRIIVGMIFNQKAAIDGNHVINNNELQTKIDAEEGIAQEIAMGAAEFEERDDEYAADTDT